MNQLLVDGVDVKYEPCDHCAASPSDSDIRSAIRMALRDLAERTCGVCGQSQHLEAVTLYHYKGSGQDRWCTRTTEAEPMLLLEDRTGLSCLQVRVHPECALKAIPHVKWGFSPVAQKR